MTADSAITRSIPVARIPSRWNKSHAVSTGRESHPVQSASSMPMFAPDSSKLSSCLPWKPCCTRTVGRPSKRTDFLRRCRRSCGRGSLETALAGWRLGKRGHIGVTGASREVYGARRWRRARRTPRGNAPENSHRRLEDGHMDFLCTVTVRCARNMSAQTAPTAAANATRPAS